MTNRWLGAILCCLAVGCARPEPPPPAPPLILLVTVDSLRADALTAHPGDAPATADFASAAHRFTNAYTPCSWTKPAIASFLTSTLVSRHLVFFTTLDRPSVEAYLGRRFRDDHGRLYRRGNVLPGHLPLFHERLEGYRRLAVAENVHLRAELGFARGWDRFEHVTDRKGEPGIPSNADRINTRALDLLDRHRGENVLLWVHYFDVHWPYGPVTGPGALILGDHLDSLPSPLTHAALDELAEAGPDTPFARDVLPTLYRAGVRAFDDHLGALLGAISERGLLDEALVVVTSDHGDEFFEHGAFGHGKNLYDTTIGIPLLIKLPGQRDGADHDALVSLIDVGPTVLDLAGLEPPEIWQGRSLLPIINGEPAPARAVISEVVNRRLEPYKAIMHGRHKLILGPNEGVEELTPLADDSIAAEPDPALVGELRHRLLDAVRAWDLLDLLAEEDLSGSDAPIENQEEIERQLEALGYL